MRLRKIQMSRIEMQRIRSVVGVGLSSAYQVVVSPGRSLGCAGHIMPVMLAEATNQDDYDVIDNESFADKIRSLLKF